MKTHNIPNEGWVEIFDENDMNDQVKAKVLLAATKVKMRTLIFWNTALAIQQWKYQFRKFTDIPEEKIICLTAKHVNEAAYKKVKDSGFVLIMTYNMISKYRKNFKTEKTVSKQEILEDLKAKE